MNSAITKDNKTGDRILSLDILRCLAILMVFSLHMGQDTGVNYFARGGKGVQLFFILSGYLIFPSYEKCKAGAQSIGGGIGKYYFKKIRDIVPLYYVAILLNYLYVWGNQGLLDGESLKSLLSFPHGDLSARWLVYPFFLQAFIPAEKWAWNNRGGLWTMSSFALIYLLTPVLFKALSGRRKRYLLLAVTVTLWIMRAAMVQGFFHWLAPYYLDSHEALIVADEYPLNNLAYFLAGVTIYEFRDSEIRYGIALLAGVALAYTYGSWLPAELVFILIFVVVLESHFERVLPRKICQAITWLSRFSYFFYLFHGLVGNVLVGINVRTLRFSGVVYFFAFSCVDFIICCGLYRIWKKVQLQVRKKY